MIEINELTVVLVAVTIITAAVAFVKNRQRWKNFPPGPRGLPVLGYLPFIRSGAPYLTLTELSRKYGGIFSLNFGLVPVVALADHKLIRQAFSKDVFCGRPPLKVTYGILRGYGLFSGEGRWWKEHRRFVNDSFRELGCHRNAKNKDDLIVHINEEVTKCIQDFESYEGKCFNCRPILYLRIANVICQLLFGRSFSASDKAFQHQLFLVEIGFRDVGVMGAMNFLPFLRILPMFSKVLDGIMGRRKVHQAFLTKIIDEHKRAMKNNEPPSDYTGLFLRQMQTGDGEIFNDCQLLHVLADLFGAGVETSTVTLQWLFLFLLAFPDVQQKVHQEMDDVLGPDIEPSLEDLPSLPYLEATIMEAQRFANLVPLGAPHGTTKDAEIGGYLIPKGTMVMALLWTVHMNPVLFPEPEKFNPDRFLDDQRKVVRPDYLIPFCVGRRMCPGDELARLELSLFVSRILHRFELCPEEGAKLDLTPEMGFTLNPPEFKMHAIARQKK